MTKILSEAETSSAQIQHSYVRGNSLDFGSSWRFYFILSQIKGF